MTWCSTVGISKRGGSQEQGKGQGQGQGRWWCYSHRHTSLGEPKEVPNGGREPGVNERRTCCPLPSEACGPLGLPFTFLLVIGANQKRYRQFLKQHLTSVPWREAMGRGGDCGNSWSAAPAKSFQVGTRDGTQCGQSCLFRKRSQNSGFFFFSSHPDLLIFKNMLARNSL